jgi:hypothetical protein
MPSVLVTQGYASVEAYREKKDWYFSPVGLLIRVQMLQLSRLSLAECEGRALCP